MGSGLDSAIRHLLSAELIGGDYPIAAGCADIVKAAIAKYC